MSRAWISGLLLLLGIGAVAQPPAPAGPRRMALVIGNWQYLSLPQLPSVRADLTVIAKALRQSGFEVHSVENMTVPEFYTGAEAEFRDHLKPGDVCFIYYSGYAVQADDDNYLLPVNFEPQSSKDMQDRAYHFKRLQQMLESRGVALKIFLLEASQAINVAVSGASGPGLMEPQISESSETLFVSAAFSGQVIPAAADGNAGLLTQAAAEFISVPGLSLPEVFDRIREQVGLATDHRQIPYIASNVLQSNFYFRLPEKKPEVSSAPAPKPGEAIGVPISNRTDREEYILIPAGKFKMGCVPRDSRCESGENPRHDVAISKNFWMGRNEVQVGSYRRFIDSQSDRKLKMPAGPIWDSRWKVTDSPVVNVRWDEAAAYCAWAGGRLPTEAEWEYAARGGADGQIYPLNDENSRDRANFSGKHGNDEYDFVAPVRKFDPNPFGLYDMAGNVWEWVNDWYGPYSTAGQTDPKGAEAGTEHVIRGGSWDADPKEQLRISYRKGYAKSAPSVGFRCALEDSADVRKRLALPQSSH